MTEPWAIVPVKQLVQAKNRLAPVLTEQERQALMIAMLRDVLAALCNTPELGGVLLATRSNRATEIAASMGLSVFAETPGCGQSAALTEAAEYVARHHGAGRVLLMSADIPGVTRDDVRQVLAQTAPVVLVPDRHGTGTSAVLSDLPLGLVLQFGEDSLRKHKASSHPPAVVFPNERIGGDVDTLEDLLVVSRRLPDGATRRYLERSGIMAKLAARRAAETGKVSDSSLLEESLS